MNGRDLYLQRVLDVADRDPEARENNWFFDAVGLNIYRAPDDVYRIGSEVDAVLAARDLHKPRWLAETNCLPFDDPATPKPDDGQRCTLEEQSAFAIQAYAMALGPATSERSGTSSPTTTPGKSRKRGGWCGTTTAPGRPSRRCKP